MVQITLAILHQQNGGDAGQLEGGVIAGGLGPALQTGSLCLKQVADPIGLAIHGTDQCTGGTQTTQHIKLDVSDHPALLSFCQRSCVGAGALLSVFLVGETDKPKLSIRFNIFQCVRRIEQGGYP